MSSARKSSRKQKEAPIVGTWFNAEEYATEVEFSIARAGESLSISVRDANDGEEADVFETAYDGDILSFAAHWNSTGRFARYRLRLLSQNRLSVTYTYTDHETYHRKGKRKKA